jgi:hypothetical protein
MDRHGAPRRRRTNKLTIVRCRRPASKRPRQSRAPTTDVCYARYFNSDVRRPNKRRAVTDEEVVKATSAAPGFFSQTLISECASRHFFICYASTEECATPRERSMPGLQDSSDVAAVSTAATRMDSAASTLSILYFTPVTSLALGIPLLTVKGTDFKPGQLL